MVFPLTTRPVHTWRVQQTLQSALSVIYLEIVFIYNGRKFFTDYYLIRATGLRISSNFKG